MATSDFSVVINGLIKENPTFVLLLGMCPTLGTTSSAINGMSMGLATAFVLICSNVVIAAIKGVIPDKVRIPSFIVISATFVTVVQMIMEAYVPALYKTLGLYMLDGIGIGLGFTCSLTVLGALREFLGTGSMFGVSIFPSVYGPLLFVLAPGAFLVLGYLLLLFNRLVLKK